MDALILRDEIIKPVIMRANMYSESAAQLLLATAAVESHIGEYLHQIDGPAIGLYQIEPATHVDVLTNYVAFRPRLQKIIDQYRVGQDPPEQLIGSLEYQTLIARLIYARVPTSLPAANDIRGLANYWKDHYNTYLGKGTVEHFIECYNKYVGDI